MVDDFDRNVTLPTHAERILSLGPHITENLFSAGAGDKIIGVTAHSDYPPAANNIQSIGSAYAGINLEAVLSLKPDFIVAWQTAGNRDSLAKLIEWGFVLYYSEPRTFDDIIDNIRDFAKLAGTQNRIDPSPQALRDELASLREQFSQRETMRVFYQIWREPLITLNGAHYISRALELCGARNVFAKLPMIAPRVSVEAVLDAAPDIIIAGRGDGWTVDTALWRKWQSLPAVRYDGLLAVDGARMHRHTARMITGIRAMCEQIDAVRRVKLAQAEVEGK